MSKGSRNFLIVVFGLGFVMLALLPIVRSWASPASQATASSPDRFDAQVICEKFVRNELRAPSTAKFSSSSDNAVTNNSGAMWTVRGWVDSQNGFGAQIRSNYECRASFTGRSGDNLNWNREALSITQH